VKRKDSKKTLFAWRNPWALKTGLSTITPWGEERSGWYGQSSDRENKKRPYARTSLARFLSLDLCGRYKIRHWQPMTVIVDQAIREYLGKYEGGSAHDANVSDQVKWLKFQISQNQGC
jgi:hypothetical protein